MMKLSEKALKDILEVSATSETKNLLENTLKELAKLAGVTFDSTKRDYHHFKDISGTKNDDPPPFHIG